MAKARARRGPLRIRPLDALGLDGRPAARDDRRSLLAVLLTCIRELLLLAHPGGALRGSRPLPHAVRAVPDAAGRSLREAMAEADPRPRTPTGVLRPRQGTVQARCPAQPRVAGAGVEPGALALLGEVVRLAPGRAPGRLPFRAAVADLGVGRPRRRGAGLSRGTG